MFEFLFCFQENAMNIDLGPTFITLSGQQVPSYMDGKSLTPVWNAEQNAGQKGRANSFRSELLVEHYGEHGFSTVGCPQYAGQGMAVSRASFLLFWLCNCISSVQWSGNGCESTLFSVSPPSQLHVCLPLQLYHICSGKSSESIGHSRNTDSLSKVPDSLIHKKQQQTN